MQSGHGSDTIRDTGNDENIEGIDIFMAGTYSEKREAEKDKNNIEIYMKEVQEYLEKKLHLKLSDPHSENPKWTSILFNIDKIRISIGTSNSTRAQTVSIQIEPINGRKEYINLIKKYVL